MHLTPSHCKGWYIWVVFNFFFNAFNTESWWRVIFGGHWISTFDTIFEKYSIEVFTSSLLSDTSFPFSVNVILSSVNVLFVRHGCTVFQISLLPVTWRLLKKYFLVCSLTHISLLFIRYMWWYRWYSSFLSKLIQ